MAPCCSGWPVCARRQSRLPLECGHERCSGADRRGGVNRARFSAAGGARRAGFPHGTGGRRAAPRYRGAPPAPPPGGAPGGRFPPPVAAAASLLGVTEVYARGGAGAIGALAHGVPEIDLEPVQRVAGPGNVFVAAAKRVVQGITGIDAEAGPTDILVIADDSADADIVAADLISQAEHDELAASVLVTTSVRLATAVAAHCARRVAATQHRERVTAALSGAQSAIVLVDDLAQAAAFANAFGPEHLEIQVSEPDATLARIDNAGAIFVGEWSPVSLGDYAAGSNHVLPTGGQARYAAGLSAATFLRSQQVVRYDQAALREVASVIHTLAAEEDLPAHAAAISARFGRS